MPNSTQILATTTIAISASLPTTFDDDVSTGYPSLTYTAIGQVTDWSAGGKVFNVVTSNPIAQRNTDKYKGTFNTGADSFSVNRDDDDAGQVIALAALASDNDYSFKITFSDATDDYYTGKIISFDTVAGGADSIVQRTIQVERTRDAIVTT